MTIVFRIVISAIVIVATFYFMYWVPLALVPHIPCGIAAVLSYAAAMAAGWYAWTRTAALSGSLVTCVGYGALVTGAIGFVLGFFGPLIIAPEANQGPLLGILITGPAGVVLGAIGGLVYWFTHKKSEGSDAAA